MNFVFIWPLPLDYVSLYVAYLYKEGASESTIRGALSVIAWQHNLRGLPDPTKDFLLKKMLVGLKRTLPQAKKVFPISKDLLNKCLMYIDRLGLKEFDQVALAAILLLGYHGCLRVGEMLLSNNLDNTLMFHNTTFLEDGNYSFCLNTFKHSRRPQKLLLEKDDTDAFCPVRTLLAFYAIRPRVSGALFVNAQGTPFKRIFLAKHLKKLLELVGENPLLFNTHSLRVGRATDLALAGESELRIREIGRWNSNAYLGYVRFNLIKLSVPR